MIILVRPSNAIYTSRGFAYTAPVDSMPTLWVRIVDTPHKNLVHFFGHYMPLYRSLLTTLLNTYSQNDFYIPWNIAVDFVDSSAVPFTIHRFEDINN